MLFTFIIIIAAASHITVCQLNFCVRIVYSMLLVSLSVFFFQAEDGIRDAHESRGLGDVYKRQGDDNHGIRRDFFVFSFCINDARSDVDFSDFEGMILSLIHI